MYKNMMRFILLKNKSKLITKLRDVEFRIKHINFNAKINFDTEEINRLSLHH